MPPSPPFPPVSPAVLAAIVAALIAFVVGGTAAAACYRRQRLRRINRDQLQKTAALIDSDNPAEALVVVRKESKRTRDTAATRQWRDLELSACEMLGDVDSAVRLFDENSLGFAEHEPASLWVARAALESRRLDTFADVAGLWRDRESASGAWHCLEADALAQQGRQEEARELLEARTLTDSHEGGRLARLAAQRVDAAPDEARYLMKQALASGPEDPEVYLRGSRVLEQLDRVTPAAEFVEQAVRLAPRDPFVRGQAGDFYRQHGNLIRALQIWSECLEAPSIGFLWLKTLFWHRVARPVPIRFERMTRPEGPLRPLIDLLLNLSPQRFWDEKAFAPIAERAPELARRQEVYWLRLLEYIRAGQDERALALLSRARFGRRAWHPPLESALLQIVTFRTHGAPDSHSALDLLTAGRPTHAFFLDIEEWTREGRSYGAFLRLMHSDEAAAAACLAVGWDEAGLRLQHVAHFSGQFPEWYMCDLHTAWQRNGTGALATQFVHRSHRSHRPS